MLPTQKQYIINLANLGTVPVELVGELALTFREELTVGIPIPLGFIVTSTAFDDFLIANDLVEVIGSRINETDYTNIDEVKRASQEIRQLIHKATMPQIIANPIAKAYGGMSGFTEAGVNLLVSSLNTQLEQSVSKTGKRRYQVMGQQNIIEAIKDLWAEFFSLDALLFRNQIEYEGFLTEAIIIQKMIFPEISGKIYTFNPTDNNKSVFEIQAVWGGDDTVTEFVPDSYYLDSSTSEVLERKLNPQTEMLVRKNKYDGKSLFAKIKISQMMQKRAKLEDRNLHQLYVYASKMCELIDKPLELNYCIEGGRTYITEFREWEHEPEISNSVYLNKLALNKSIDLDSDWGSKIEIIPGEPDLNPDDDYAYIKKAEKNFQKDLDAYVDEIQESSAKTAPRFGQPIPAPAVVVPVVAAPVPPVTVTPVTPVSETPSNQAKPEQQPAAEKAEAVKPVAEEKKEEPVKVPEKEITEKEVAEQVVDIESSEDKVVVDIKPVEELATILKGKGNGAKTRFGLSHFVFENFDLEDLTGDEVLVLKELNDKSLKVINNVRGAVIEKEPAVDLLAGVTIPVIFGINNAFEIIRDREVITLEPETGKIYLGAGIKASQVTDADVAETTNENKPEKESLEEEIKKADIELPRSTRQDELKVAATLPATNNEHPLIVEPQTEPEKTDFTVNIYEDPSIAPLNATSEFWQTVDMQSPKVDVKNTAGIIISAEQLYLKFELEPADVYSDKYAFKTFLFKAANFIKELVLRSNGRTIIYQSASRDFMEAKNITEHVHDMVLVDLEVVTWLRNRENIRNIWYSFADVTTLEYLTDLKKNITSEGIRRSATFKVFAHISQPYAALAIKSFVENGNIDGVIIDLDRMIKAMGVNFKELDDNLANFLRYVIEIVNVNNCQTFIWNREIAIDNAQIKLFLEKGLGNFITPVENVMSTKLQVSDQELSRLIKQQKRGRKPKKIDFGF